MPRCLIKLQDKNGKSFFGEWSTVVDAPVSQLMPLSEFKKWYVEKYGEEGREDMPERLIRVMRTGTSFISSETAEELIAGNRAGEHETELSKEEIIKQYADNQ